MRKQIFLDIQQKVLSIVDNDNNPIIKHFDLWNNQLKFLAYETPFASPAVFLEFNDIEWHTLVGNIKDGDFSFSLHIVTKWLGNTNSNVPTDTQSSQLDFLDLPEKITNAIDHSRITNSSTIVLEHTKFDNNHEDYIETIDTYKCRCRYAI